MLRLHWYTLTFILWTLFFFNVERLDIGGINVLNISTRVYILAMFLIGLALILPHWIQTSLLGMNIVALFLFVVSQSTQSRLIFAEVHPTYVRLFELGAVLISTSLAHKVGQTTVDFVETVRTLLLYDMPNTFLTAAESDSRVSYEMQYARRENRPFTVIAISPGSEQEEETVHSATAREIRDLLTRRYRLLALSRLIAWRIRRTDFVLDRSQEGQLILVAPKVQNEQATEIIERLQEQIDRQLGIKCNWGMANFPAEGVTFEELVDRARQNLDSNRVYKSAGHTFSTNGQEAQKSNRTESFEE